MTASLPARPALALPALLGPDAVIAYPADGTEQSHGGQRMGLAEHYAAYGPVPEAAAALLPRRLADAGLRGRGGAYFPAATKWAALLAGPGGGTVVANGSEGEPGSAKDAALWQHRPHLVLDGLATAGRAVSAERLVAWIHADDHRTRASVQAALAERRAAGLDEPIDVVAAPSRYLSGEASAVIRALRGGPALPLHAADPARPWGAGAPPVLVHNTETLARIGLLARTPGPPETSLVTVVDAARRTVVEVPAGVTFGLLLSRAPAPAAVLLGGTGGQWVPWDTLRELPASQDGLASHGLSLGAGVVGLLPAGTCGLRETARMAAWLSQESAQQCGPCRFGLPDLATDVDALARGRLPRRRYPRLRQTLGLLPGRGACRLPDGAVRMTLSALDVFAMEVEHHLDGTCTASSDADVFCLPARSR